MIFNEIVFYTEPMNNYNNYKFTSKAQYCSHMLRISIWNTYLNKCVPKFSARLLKTRLLFFFRGLSKKMLFTFAHSFQASLVYVYVERVHEMKKYVWRKPSYNNNNNNNNYYYISTGSPYHRGVFQCGPALTIKYTLLYNKFI